jgi:glucokinase
MAGMTQVREHVLASDVGGTHIGLAVFAWYGEDRFEMVHHETHRSRKTSSYSAILEKLIRTHGRRLRPAISAASIDFAGPVGPDRSCAEITNLDWGFSADEIRTATGLDRVTLLNDFEAVGYGFEVLRANRPDAFVRLSRTGKLPALKGKKPTVAIIGAGTGLGTAILVQDSATGRYRPIPGEGGHADFIAVDEEEFRIAEWIRKNVNHSPQNPADCERVVSGPGLINLFYAVAATRADLADEKMVRKIDKADSYDRPAQIIGGAQAGVPLARRTVDLWLRAYGRAAKNHALFPLTPGGVFLAGGIAARILPEMQSGLFMKEFRRCDMPNIRRLLVRTPVFVITDYQIGLYGCANAAIHGVAS